MTKPGFQQFMMDVIRKLSDANAMVTGGSMTPDQGAEYVLTRVKQLIAKAG